MTQEDKELLLKDLSARLPYGVKCAYFNTENEIKVGELLTIWCKEKRVFIDKLSIDYDGCDCIGVIPYLFPLSSMTEEQRMELNSLLPVDVSLQINSNNFTYFEINTDLVCCFHIEFWDKFFDWLNKNHFDYRGLIEKSLALDASNLNIY